MARLSCSSSRRICWVWPPSLTVISPAIFCPSACFNSLRFWTCACRCGTRTPSQATPSLPTAQSAVFYPVSNALLVLTSFDRSAAARLYWLQVEAALHIFLACLFTYMLVRRLTANKMAAFIAGAVFGFSGHWLQGTKACPNRCVSCPANRVCETGYIMGQPESRQRSRAGQDRNCTWLSNYIQAGISSMAQIPASSLSTQTCSGSIRLECTPSSLHMPSTTTFAHRQK